jgi:hypothetical protein
MGHVDERREVVYGLSGDEARECLAQKSEERLQHDRVHLTEPQLQHDRVHLTEPQPGEMKRVLQELVGSEDVPENVRISHSSVERAKSHIIRTLIYASSDEEAREGLLNTLGELDEHWRIEHPDQPEPGIENLRRVVTKVRQHRR